jgi:hypothetical protein
LVTDWAAQNAALERLAKRQIFFVGGAPRSGTTWLARLMDAHPAISCGGEALFGRELADKLDKLTTERRAALAAKNNAVFRDGGGYALPESADTDTLLRTAILLALQRQSAGRDLHAIGEKTPENVFLFPRLKTLFPQAKLISIARDPRDVLASAWHFFHHSPPGEDEIAAKTAFIDSAIPSLDAGAREMLGHADRFPGDTVIVTYEAMLQSPAPIAEHLFGFLGAPTTPDITSACVARTSFTALTGGRAPGTPQQGAFLRQGTAGDWRTTFTPAMNDRLLMALGWMFPHFGWQP